MDAAMEAGSPARRSFRSELREEKIRYRSIRESGSDSVEVILRDEKQN